MESEQTYVLLTDIKSERSEVSPSLVQANAFKGIQEDAPSICTALAWSKLTLNPRYRVSRYVFIHEGYCDIEADEVQSGFDTISSDPLDYTDVNQVVHAYVERC
jgi:hypothetical protein